MLTLPRAMCASVIVLRNRCLGTCSPPAGAARKATGKMNPVGVVFFHSVNLPTRPPHGGASHLQMGTRNRVDPHLRVVERYAGLTFYTSPNGTSFDRIRVSGQVVH